MRLNSKVAGCSHICYEWETLTMVQLAGEKIWLRDAPHSLILHCLDDLRAYPQIPSDAYKTPVWYSYENKRWYLANGTPLELPYRVKE